MARDDEGKNKSKYKVLSIKEKQLASLETLKHMKSYCEENGIRYYLAYGTLLGAVRHKGFIPWDDDVDLMIPRPDYERLISDYHDDKNQFKLVSCFNDKSYHLPYAKIENCRTARLKDGVADSNGIGIDLFPIDGIPDNLTNARKKFEKQNNKFIKVTNRFYSYSLMPTSSVINVIKRLLGKAAMKSGINNLVVRGIARQMFEESYSSCNLLACVTGIHSGRFIPFKKEWFETVKLDFEGDTFDCPRGYHEILKAIYNDYMAIPKADERQSTHTEEFIWKYE